MRWCWLTYGFDVGQEISQFCPGAPDKGVSMYTFDQVFLGIFNAITLGKDDTVEILQPTMILSLFALDYAFLKPVFESPCNLDQFFVDCGAGIHGAHDHLTVFVLAFLTSHVFRIQSQEEGLLTHSR